MTGEDGMTGSFIIFVRMKLKITFALLLLALLFSFYGYFQSETRKQRILPFPEGTTYPFEIKQGMSTKNIANSLLEFDFISNKSIFEWLARFKGFDKKIQSGLYLIPQRVSMTELLVLFTTGKVATIKVTLPEGRNSWEYFGILKKHFALDSLLFDSLVHDQQFSLSCSINASSLEGYLFPDTYDFPYKSTERQLLKILTRQFNQVLQSLPLKGSEVYQKYGLHGLLTLASIVEEEAMVAKEQPLIAGVFYNRLLKNWPLGADPTVRFAIKKLRGPLYRSELANTSPYNTRLHTGLPPGPISNPGKGAILAAASPDKTPYMFFVAKDNGSREHYFSETNKQHVSFKNKRKDNQQK